jgi:hypothetical protein
MRLAFAAAVFLVLASAPAVALEEPVSALIAGTFHRSNPGQDLRPLVGDDVLAARRHAEVAAVGDALTQFRPTHVAVEWPPALISERYAAHRGGTLGSSSSTAPATFFCCARASQRLRDSSWSKRTITGQSNRTDSTP